MFGMFNIIYRSWKRRSGRLMVPSDFFVGHVKLHREEFDPITGKLINEGYEDLGHNLIVNAGRDRVAEFLADAPATLGKVDYAKWSNGGSTEVSLGQTTLTNAAIDVRPALIVGSETGTGATYTFDTAPARVLRVNTGDQGYETINLPSANATTLEDIVDDINSESSNNLRATSVAGSLILYNNHREGATNTLVLETNVTNSAHVIFGFSPDTGETTLTKSGDDFKKITASVTNRVVLFTVNLRSDTGNDSYKADIFPTSSPAPTISEIGLWMEELEVTGLTTKTEAQRFFARKTFEENPQSKSSAVSLGFSWSVDCSQQ